MYWMKIWRRLKKEEINKLREFYHLKSVERGGPVVEIETGDVPVHHVEEKKIKEKESEAVRVIKDKIPNILGEKFAQLFTKFEEQKTKEVKLAKVIDALDSLIHFP